MSAADPKHVAFACPTYLLFDVANTIDCITGNPLEWYRRRYRACDHSRRKLWLVAKPTSAGSVLIGRGVPRWDATAEPLVGYYEIATQIAEGRAGHDG